MPSDQEIEAAEKAYWEHIRKSRSENGGFVFSKNRKAALIAALEAAEQVRQRNEFGAIPAEMANAK